MAAAIATKNNLDLENLLNNADTTFLFPLPTPSPSVTQLDLELLLAAAQGPTSSFAMQQAFQEQPNINSMPMNTSWKLEDMELLQQLSTPPVTAVTHNFEDPEALFKMSPRSSTDDDGQVSDSSSHSGGEPATENHVDNDTTTAKRAIRSAQPRKKWKCSAAFLLNSITPQERAKLHKQGITAPAAGVTKISKEKEKVLRQALRKIRNVASAQRSRAAQRDYIGTLKQERDAACDKTAKLEQKVGNLEDENRTLRQQLEELRTMILGNSIVSNGASGGACLFMICVCAVISSGPLGAVISHTSSSQSLTPKSYRSRTLKSDNGEPCIGDWQCMLAALLVTIVLGLVIPVVLRYFTSNGSENSKSKQETTDDEADVSGDASTVTTKESLSSEKSLAQKVQSYIAEICSSLVV
eukprot:m.20977 g.20977  ORF g.20977 m.20977 type:complete len:411 (-) comp7004_c0_seq1:329-1561(-)